MTVERNFIRDISLYICLIIVKINKCYHARDNTYADRVKTGIATSLLD